MFTDVAIGGYKYSGKTTVQEYLIKTRNYFSVLSCKQPIVEAFEKYSGKKYTKLLDKELISFSTNILRAKSPNVVVEYLQVVIPRLHQEGKHLVSADMRFPEENRYFSTNGFLCLKVDTREEVRLERGLARDGTVENYCRFDDTERHADNLKYNYIVENNSSPRALTLQVERLLERHFIRANDDNIPNNAQVRVIDPNVNEFYEVGKMIRYLGSNNWLVQVGERVPTYYNRNDLLVLN